VGYGLAALGASALIAGYNESLFQIVTEGFSIILAALIYVLAVKTFRYSRNNPLLLIGYAYFFIGLFYLIHVVTYTPLNIFPGIRAGVSARINGFGYFFQAVAFLTVPLLIQRRFSRKIVLEILAVFSIVLIVASAWDQVAPFKFWDNAPFLIFVSGATLIILLLATAGLHFYLKRKQLNDRIYQNMMATIFFTTLAAVCELFLMKSPVLNWVGHAAKIAANLWVYKLVITFGIEAPYDLIFKELKNNVILDTLTGIYNRNGLLEFIKKLVRGRREDSPVGILLIDLDNFKGINDRFGHLAGDKVLKSFAMILKTTVRENDIVCRLGGDEFVVLLKGDGESLDLVRWRIQEAFQSWQETDEIARKIGLSIGSAIWESDQKLNIEWLIKEADLSMYNEKTKKKVSKKGAEMVQLTMFGIDIK
jgi:diguanylate cyclase (GGDEF)-like protein